MKSDPLPVFVSLALTLMTGAVISHWAGLDERIELARQSLSANGSVVLDPAAPEKSWITTIIEPSTRPQPAEIASAPVTGDTRELNRRLVAVVERMQGEQENLRDQIAEANRDLMELQFRIDTHSESFRPLRTAPDADPRPVGGGGVLPPLEIP